MKPTKLLMDLDDRNMEITKKVYEIIDTHDSNPCCISHEKSANQTKLKDLFVWLDEVLDWATSLEKETIKVLDEKLISNSDAYFSDYEVFTKQYGSHSQNKELDSIAEEILGRIQYEWQDYSLVFSLLQEDDAKHQSHLNWRRTEKMNHLASIIDNFDSVTTETKIYYQYIVNLRAGKWNKKVFEPKNIFKPAKNKDLSMEKEIPF